MAGHSKWSKIKRKKALTDAKKSKEFGKVVRLLTLESRKARGDRNAPGLRLAIEKAKELNMPGDNIERALLKGSGSEADAFEAVTYEAYGPGGSALIIETLTDSRNRTSAELRHLLSENGGNLAEPRSALWAFTKTESGWDASTTVPIAEDDATKLEVLMEKLDDMDDVQDVYSNAA